MKYHIISVTSFNQNCSIIWCEKSNNAIIIDPGGEKEKLYKTINVLQLNIEKIVLTHGHIDHVGAAVFLKNYYKVPIFGPNEADRFLLNDLFLQWKLLGLSNSNSCKINPDFWLKDGDQIQVGYENFRVLHCPGHSPGHIVLWNKVSKFIVMGDVLFKGNIGRTDLPGGDYNILVNSIKTKLIPLGDEISFLPGHGLGSTLGYERINNPHLK